MTLVYDGLKGTKTCLLPRVSFLDYDTDVRTEPVPSYETGIRLQ